MIVRSKTLLCGAFVFCLSILLSGNEYNLLEEQLQKIEKFRGWRSQAVKEMIPIIDKVSPQQLADLLHSKKNYVQQKRVLLAAYVQSQQTDKFSWLSQQLIKVTDRQVINMIFYCLHHIAEPDDLDALLQMPISPENSRYLWQLLTKFPGKKSFLYLYNCWKEGKSVEQQYLMQTADGSCSEMVRQMLKSEDEPTRQLGINCACKILAIEVVELQLTQEKLIDRLLEQLRGNHQQTQPEYNEKMAEELVELYKNLPNSIQNKQAIIAQIFAENFSLELNHSIYKRVDLHDDIVKKVYLAKSISFSLHCFEKYQELVEALNSADHKIRSQALFQLKETYDWQLIPCYLHFLNDPFGQVREDALDSIYLLLEKNKELLAYFQGESQEKLFTSIKQQLLIDKVQFMLRDIDPDVQIAAVQTLVLIKSKQTYPDIISLTGSKYFAVRLAAMDAIAQREIRSATSKMKELLNDPDWRIRARAARVYFEMQAKEKDEINMLLQAFAVEKDTHVLKELEAALGKADGEFMMEQLRKQLKESTDIQRLFQISSVLVQQDKLTLQDLGTLRKYFKTHPEDTFRRRWLELVQEKLIDVEAEIFHIINNKHYNLLDVAIETAAIKKIAIGHLLLQQLPHLASSKYNKVLLYIANASDLNESQKESIIQKVFAIPLTDYADLMIYLYDVYSELQGNNDDFLFSIGSESNQKFTSLEKSISKILKQQIAIEEPIKQRLAMSVLILVMETSPDQHLLRKLLELPDKNSDIKRKSYLYLIHSLNKKKHLHLKEEILKVALMYDFSPYYYEDILQNLTTEELELLYQKLSHKNRVTLLRSVPIKPTEQLLAKITELQQQEVLSEYDMKYILKTNLANASPQEVIDILQNTQGLDYVSLRYSLSDKQEKDLKEYIKDPQNGKKRLSILPLLGNINLDDKTFAEAIEYLPEQEFKKMYGYHYKNLMDKWVLEKMKAKDYDFLLKKATTVNYSPSTEITEALEKQLSLFSTDQQLLLLKLLLPKDNLKLVHLQTLYPLLKQKKFRQQTIDILLSKQYNSPTKYDRDWLWDRYEYLPKKDPPKIEEKSKELVSLQQKIKQELIEEIKETKTTSRQISIFYVIIPYLKLSEFCHYFPLIHEETSSSELNVLLNRLVLKKVDNKDAEHFLQFTKGYDIDANIYKKIADSLTENARQNLIVKYKKSTTQTQLWNLVGFCLTFADIDLILGYLDQKNEESALYKEMAKHFKMILNDNKQSKQAFVDYFHNHDGVELLRFIDSYMNMDSALLDVLQKKLPSVSPELQLTYLQNIYLHRYNELIFETHLTLFDNPQTQLQACSLYPTLETEKLSNAQKYKELYEQIDKMELSDEMQDRYFERIKKMIERRAKETVVEPKTELSKMAKEYLAKIAKRKRFVYKGLKDIDQKASIFQYCVTFFSMEEIVGELVVFQESSKVDERAFEFFIQITAKHLQKASEQELQNFILSTSKQKLQFEKSQLREFRISLSKKKILTILQEAQKSKQLNPYYIILIKNLTNHEARPFVDYILKNFSNENLYCLMLKYERK